MSVLTITGLNVALPPGSNRSHAVRPHAVHNVGFSLERGEILAIVGGSGAGKSMLAAAIMGALPGGLRTTGGSIRLGETEIAGLAEPALRNLRGNRIALIPQEPRAALNPAIRAGRQIEEVLILHSRLDAAARRARVLALLGDMHLDDPARIAASFPHQLSGGQCQRIAIAMALAMHPDVLIADEPTTALDVTTQAQILALIGDLRRRGDHGIVFITHDLGVVRDIADRIAVMADGAIVEIGTADAVLNRPAMPATRALLAAVTPLDATESPPDCAPMPPELLRITAVSRQFGAVQALRNVDLTLYAGQTLALVGESGCGKTTLARLLIRIIDPSSGQITMDDGFFAHEGAALRTGRRSIQMVFQDPFGALNPRRTVGAMLIRAARLAGDDAVTARKRALELLESVGLPREAAARRPAAFSGGERQRIGIARALAMRPRLLIADESVSALDMPVQRQILALLADLQARLGIAILFITHDLRIASAIADRIAVMKDGEIIEIAAPAALLARPRTAYARALIAAIPGKTAAERARIGAGIE